MTTFQGRWGYHPIDRETFVKLKQLHKRYWETLQAVARWFRHDAKTVHKRGNPPSYCPIFVEEKPCHVPYAIRGGYTGYRYRSKTMHDHGICACYKAARRPACTPESVEKLQLTKEQIDALHAEVEAWFSTVAA